MLESLIQIDKALTLSINYLHTDVLDFIMLWSSEKVTWIPLYALIAYLLFRQFGAKYLVFILILTIVNVTLTDQISVFAKNYFERLRPCHQLEMLEHLRLISSCGGQFGFVSSHAANTAGLAVFIGMVLQNKWMNVVLIGYAILNGYSRIYLGKHYSFDVIGGFLLGVMIGLCLYQLSEILSKRFANLKS